MPGLVNLKQLPGWAHVRRQRLAVAVADAGSAEQVQQATDSYLAELDELDDHRPSSPEAYQETLVVAEYALGILDSRLASHPELPGLVPQPQVPEIKRLIASAVAELQRERGAEQPASVPPHDAQHQQLYEQAAELLAELRPGNVAAHVERILRNLPINTLRHATQTQGSHDGQGAR